MTICTDVFMPMAFQERVALGMPEVPVVAVTHPLGGEREPAVMAKAEKVVDLVARMLTLRPAGSGR